MADKRNQREFGTPYIRNAAKAQFERTMQREGRIFTTYTDSKDFRAFFRIRNDNENQRQTIVMYYDISAPIYSGTLVMIGKEVFLALNKETVENDVYYKSTLIKCNGIYNDNHGSISNIPFYSDNIKSSLSIGDKVITSLNGNVELLTEENSSSKKIKIDQYFNEFGRTFKVVNLYVIDGIVHVIGEVYSDMTPQIIYNINIVGVPITYVKPNKTIQLSAIPYINGSETTGVTFNWTSSDNSIAIVDNTGKVTALSEGTVKIIVIWTEKDISEFVYITVASDDVQPVHAYKYNITGNTNLRCNYKRAYTFSAIDSDEKIIDNIEFRWSIVSDFEVLQETSNNKITLSVSDEERIGSSFMLQVIVNKEVKAEIKINVVE